MSSRMPSLLTALLLAGASALAQEAAPAPRSAPSAVPSAAGRVSPEPRPSTAPGGMRFGAMDKNRDGKISREEWRGNDKSFADRDKDKDGVLAGAELLPAAGGTPGAASPSPRPSPASR